MNLLEFEARLLYPSGFSLDLTFEAGEGVTALLGPSGSGKSTALSMIAGFRTPDAGVIRLGGVSLFDRERRTNLPPEQRGVAYVHQQHLLFPHLSVGSNVLYGWRRARPERRSLAPERVISVLELAPLLERRPATLSGGQRQRVALARAILASPSLLLLDEPVASLDQANKERILSYIEQALSECRIPALYVTHDRHEVDRLASRIVYLRDGHRVRDAATT